MKTVLKYNVCRSALNKIFKYSRLQLKVRNFSDSPYSDGVQKFNPFSKKIYNKITQESESKIATRICITIFGNGAVGQPRCVALFTEFKAFFFNCGEGVGRLCKEYEVNTCQLKHVFITQRTWKNLGGLPDLYLANEVFGVPRMCLYGPPGIELITTIISASRLGLSLVKKDAYIDENLEIKSIPIKSSKPERTLYSHSKVDANGGNSVDSYSYVCRIFKKLGDFNPEKCVEQGVPIGPHLLQLKNGEDVVLPSGRVIHSSDVLDSLQPEIIFLVVDCPSESFLDAFVNEAQFVEFQLPTDNARNVNFVFHFSPPHIIESKKYQEWIQKFHQNTHHYILNTSNPSISSGAIDQTQNILHLIHPEIFKLLPSEEKVDPLEISVSSEIMYPSPMLQIHLRPEKKTSQRHVISYNSEDYNEMLKEFPEFSHELTQLKSRISSMPHSKEKQEYPEVLFLGTSSSTSTAFRNVSAILVNINSRKSILLDCGEGTFMQLVRYFGQADVNSILKKISCIFISHKHSDHYLGLFELLQARREAFESSNTPYQSIALILPHKIRDIIRSYCHLFEPINSNNKSFYCKQLVTQSHHHNSLANFLGDIKVRTVPVRHCTDAYGVVLQSGSKWKIVYSGDTAPCQKLIEAGENCTLLIHEASIEDNLVTEATLKKHSTPSQILDVAEKMNAQNTIMTHFSKRYLAVPLFQESNHRNIGCAFDFMKVRLHELPMLPLFLPALKCLFREQLDSFLEKSSCVSQFENVFLRTYRSLKNG